MTCASAPAWDKVRHCVQWIGYAECIPPETRKKEYTVFAYAYTSMQLCVWGNLFPTIDMQTIREPIMKECFDVIQMFRAEGEQIIEFGVRPELECQGEAEHSQEHDDSQEDEHTSEDDDSQEDEDSSTELQQVQVSLKRQHAEISSLKNELREMHELLRSFVKRSKTIDEDDNKVNNVITPKEKQKAQTHGISKSHDLLRIEPDWQEFRHALRYVAYMKEYNSITDEHGYRVLAYANNYMPVSGWLKLFPTAKFTKLKGSINKIVNQMRLDGHHVIEYGTRPEQGKRTDLMRSNKTKHA
jgi:hypothetical protein